MDENDLDDLVVKLAEGGNSGANAKNALKDSFKMPQAKVATHAAPANNTKSGMLKPVNLVQDDPIFGSLGPPPMPIINTPEAILERDLASRKPFKWVYDPNQYPETMDSIKWAEKEK